MDNSIGLLGVTNVRKLNQVIQKIALAGEYGICRSVHAQSIPRSYRTPVLILSPLDFNSVLGGSHYFT
jgi:hypothetical protein